MILNSILLNMINTGATETYSGPIVTVDNYKIWVDHWFKTAENLATMFDNQSLPETAKAVRDIIEQQRKLVGEKYENESTSSAPKAQ